MKLYKRSLQRSLILFNKLWKIGVHNVLCFYATNIRVSIELSTEAWWHWGWEMVMASNLCDSQYSGMVSKS